jgi:hypothetical protein
MKTATMLAAVLMFGTHAVGEDGPAVTETPTAAPATQPVGEPANPSRSAEQMMQGMLRSGSSSSAQPLQAIPDGPVVDISGGKGAALREGTYVVDRVGRLTRSSDGSRAEFTFDSDANAKKAVPIQVLPNRELMAMENAVAGTSRDLPFRVTGVVTEYRGHNCVLLEKAEAASTVAAEPVAAPDPAPTVAPVTQPATQPSVRSLSAEQLLSQMLKPGNPSAARPVQAVGDGPIVDTSSGTGAVAPGAPTLNVLREGTHLVDRVGRLNRTSDGSQAELTFDSDGKAMKDPPVLILPNLKLMAMENAVTSTSRDLRFRVTGVVTEYRGRNYVMLEKVVVVPDPTQQF